ncbi:MAG TPA: DUF4097 family beta strand repeat-containing protein [Mycobacteriales bacterium]|nr:DUF4097 family beta strand repeat-containing protein [Mycobacteriales bacterium]
MPTMHTFETPGPVHLRVVNMCGRVSVRAGDRDHTDVEVTGVPSDDGEVSVEHRDHGGRHVVSVTVPRPRRRFLGLVTDDYVVEVSVPTGTSVHVVTASADIDLSGPLADVEVKSASGDVRVDRCTTARLTVVSGDIVVERVEDGCTAGSVSGDIELGHATGDVTARTVSGDLQVRCADDGVLTVRTVSGDVAIGVLRGSAVAVDVGSASGDLQSEFELSSTPDPDESDRPLVDVRVQTVSGDVRLTRAGDVAGAA